MIRNVVALIMGVITSFSAISMTGFILINFQVNPFYHFLSVAISGDGKAFVSAGRSVMYYFIFIIFPLVAITTGVITGLIAKNRLHFIGAISIMPLIISINLFAFSMDSLYMSISSLISVIFGIFIAKLIRYGFQKRG